MASIEDTTIVIIIQDSDPLCVETKILTENSPVFSYIFEQCKHEEHDLSDFEPDAVRIFITLLDDRQFSDLEPRLFRDINKMAVVFEVKWLEVECLKWLTRKVETVEAFEEKIFFFEECYFVLKRLEKTEYMDMFVDQIGRSNDTKLLSHYLSNFEDLETEMIRPLLQLGAANSEVFLKTLSSSIAKNMHLNQNALNLLQKIDLDICPREEWLGLFAKITDLPEMSTSDFRITQKLLINAWRTTDTKGETATMLVEYKKMELISDYCKTLADIITVVSEGFILRLWEVVWLLLRSVFVETSPSEDEKKKGSTQSQADQVEKKEPSPCQDKVDKFLSEMERLCEEKQLQRIPSQIIDPIISALKHSDRDNAEILVTCLTRIRQSKVMCSPNRENVTIREDRSLTAKRVENQVEWKGIYKFKHPATGKCTEQHGCCGFILKACGYKAKDKRETFKKLFDSMIGYKGYEREWENSTYELITDTAYYHIYDNRTYQGYTEVHYHDMITAGNMCVYGVYTLSLPDGNKIDTVSLPGFYWWHKKWFPEGTEREFKGIYVAYNVSDYMVAKQSRTK